MISSKIYGPLGIHVFLSNPFFHDSQYTRVSEKLNTYRRPKTLAHEWVLALLSQQQRSWSDRQCWDILAQGARLLVREVA